MHTASTLCAFTVLSPRLRLSVQSEYGWDGSVEFLSAAEGAIPVVWRRLKSFSALQHQLSSNEIPKLHFSAAFILQKAGNGRSIAAEEAENTGVFRWLNVEPRFQSRADWKMFIDSLLPLQFLSKNSNSKWQFRKQSLSTVLLYASDYVKSLDQSSFTNKLKAMRC